MTAIEVFPVVTVESPAQLGPDEQSHEIAERFLSAIDEIHATDNGPVFVAYFMDTDPAHVATEKALVGAVKLLSEYPESNCVLMTDAPTVILASLVSGNQLVVSEQVEAGARSYWVCAPGQVPQF